jgi:hypothetical protein
MQAESKRLANTLWRLSHPDQVRAHKRTYYLKHREWILAKARVYNQTDVAKAKRAVRYHARNDKLSLEGWSVKRERSGISRTKYLQLLEDQNHQCAICDQHEASVSRQTLFIDHDHATGKVRGLLCHQCNSLLGLAYDSVRILTRCMKYLERTRV